MKLKIKYRDIDHTMEKLILQVNESIPYMRKKIPQGIDTPEDLFNFLKPQLTFTPDPPETELLQTSQTLFENNPHGFGGFGDCDCFSITGIASLYVLQIPTKIVLAGRGVFQPVHIYLRVFHRNKWIPFDLTQPDYNSERHYPFKFDYFLKFVYKDPKDQKNQKKDEFDLQAFNLRRQKYLKKNLLFVK